MAIRRNLLTNPIFYDLGATHDFGIGGSFNGYLLSGGRVFGEELACFENDISPGAIGLFGPDNNTLGGNWVPNGSSDYTIMFMSQTVQTMGPGYAMGYWFFDAEFGGGFLVRPPFINIAEHFHGRHVLIPDPSPETMYNNMVFDPQGFGWAYGTYPDIEHGGAFRFDPLTLVPSSPAVTVLHADYLDPRGDATEGIVDFAVDTIADRVFVRWVSNAPGEVSVYTRSTQEFLFDLWAPNPTSNIVLADNQFVYLCDTSDWIMVYDYGNGAFLGACRNPRTEFLYGRFNLQARVYGWDQPFKRLLSVAPVANDSMGGSRMAVEAFVPVPDAMIVSPPIPRNVPRLGRRITLVSHVFGDGAEPIAVRPSVISNAVDLDMTTDRDGDLVIPFVCPDVDDFTIDVAVEDSEL